MTDDTKIADLTVSEFRELMTECIGRPGVRRWKPGMALRPGEVVMVGNKKYAVPDDHTSEDAELWGRLLAEEAERVEEHRSGYLAAFARWHAADEQSWRLHEQPDWDERGPT